jgi:hypothetical protein
MIPRDSAEMTPEDRLAELAEALASAYIRLVVLRKKELELQAEGTALCVPVVDGKDASTRKELA